MKKLTIREARQALSRLNEILADEDEVTITKHGETVARLRRAYPRRLIPSHKVLREKMRRMRRGSEVLIREERERR